MNFPAPRPAFLVSNGTAEDLIGARLLGHLGAAPPGVGARVLPLVGAGRAYAGVPGVTRVGEELPLPSGGFPFGSAANLLADLRAGLVGGSLRQWRDAARAARGAGAVVVVGDAYALMVGTLAARAAGVPLVHVQPLLSAHYLEGLGLRGALSELNALGANLPMPYELRLARGARAVFVRDAETEQYYRARGVPAHWAGSFALDVLPPPERDLPALTRGRAVLALLPGSREDHRESLPVMLRAAARVPGTVGVVAWPHRWDAVTLPDGWTLRVEDDRTARAEGEGARALLLRGAFGAVARAADVAVGTAGTANEQLAGLGVPVVAFPTGGPQYTAGFARRQGRLLGDALSVVAPSPEAVAAEVRALLGDPARRARAAVAGLGRVGAAGALPVIAAEVRGLLGGASSYPP
ncbi:lipid-A-disaccharide synthase [Deinococcus aetherius]|uniref:Lipid-A-disaccharide synthase n=1 Tax=Deinococcus aetherius TaxID=200252 RepID=A0ABN6RHY4_9DEIO|nr:lipid-A-disaccharide synthase-related protein [Deinococcus aetherius]BDP42375.1 lipid-A-disaccharide synthase [Deinococcus aetherius]